MYLLYGGPPRTKTQGLYSADKRDREGRSRNLRLTTGVRVVVFLYSETSRNFTCMGSFFNSKDKIIIYREDSL